MSNQEKSYEEYWRDGGQTVGPYVYFKQDLLKKLVGSGKRVLDVGCGDGLTSSAIASENEVYGVDVSDTALARARERGLKTEKSNLDDGLPETGDVFDFVLLLDILEHVHDPERLLDSVVSVLGGSAVLIVSVPNTMNLLSRLFFLSGRYVDVMDKSHKDGRLFSEHLHVFSKSRLEALLESRKLNVTSRHYYFPSEFNEELYKRFQFAGNLVYGMGVHRVLPSLFSLGFLYSCRLK